MKKLIATIILKLIGWKITGEKPTVKKAIVVVMHHTSNWDFPLGILNRWKWGIFVEFAIKSTMFKPPFGFIIKALGGFPVERNPNKKSLSVVDQVINRFKNADEMLFNIAPEGTRSKVNRLKTGFHRIAKDANVKIILVDFNYLTKTIHWDKAHNPSKSFQEELLIMQDFYRDSRGKYPEKSYDF